MSSSINLLAVLCILAVVGDGLRCMLPEDHGSSCSSAPSQRYHHDRDLGQCTAFQYKGCGGNMNNYKTPKECEYACLVDSDSYMKCPLYTKPIVNSQKLTTCSIDSENGDGCESKEAVCVKFMTIGFCCNRTIVDQVHEDKSAKCPSGKARWQIDGTTVLAKKCSDVTCPSGYQCNKGNFFSYCCKK